MIKENPLLSGPLEDIAGPELDEAKKSSSNKFVTATGFAIAGTEDVAARGEEVQLLDEVEVFMGDREPLP